MREVGHGVSSVRLRWSSPTWSRRVEPSLKTRRACRWWYNRPVEKLHTGGPGLVDRVRTKLTWSTLGWPWKLTWTTVLGFFTLGEYFKIPAGILSHFSPKTQST